MNKENLIEELVNKNLEIISSECSGSCNGSCGSECGSYAV